MTVVQTPRLPVEWYPAREWQEAELLAAELNGGKGRLVRASLVRISEAKNGRMEVSLALGSIAGILRSRLVLHVYQ